MHGGFDSWGHDHSINLIETVDNYQLDAGKSGSQNVTTTKRVMCFGASRGQIGGRKRGRGRKFGVNKFADELDKELEDSGRQFMPIQEKFEAFLLYVMEAGLVSDGAIAQDSIQASSFLHIREVHSPMIIMCITTSDTMRTLNNKLRQGVIAKEE
nr:D-2-hydroxyglutarate dehydrogenase, mitochondrial [Tanacetum cinerariifolium]